MSQHACGVLADITCPPRASRGDSGPLLDSCPLLHQSTYSELTDSSSRMRRIVSASSAATDNWRMRPQFFASPDGGIVSVTISSSSADFVILSTAAPDNTGWVMYATTFVAPSSFSAWAA